VSTDISARLKNDGWSTVAVPNTVDLRTVVPLLRPDLTVSIAVERISPKTRDQARLGTLSALYGLESFPLHTERAHWVTPPHYVVFRSVGAATARPTTFVDSDGLTNKTRLLQRLATVPWRVTWGDTAFDAPVLTAVSDASRRFRYDPCCMTVRDRRHMDLAAELDEELGQLRMTEHFWKADSALIIDNWRVLHGRGPSLTADFDRVLERIVVP